MGTALSELREENEGSIGRKFAHGTYGTSLQSLGDTYEVVSGDLDLSDTIIFHIPIPSSAIIKSLKFACDDLDSNVSPTLVLDIGLFAEDDMSADGTTYNIDDPIDADCIASAITEAQAGTAFKELYWEANDISKVRKKAWEIAGLDEDPNCMFTIGITVHTAVATFQAGTISLEVQFTLN